jgi:hypothetical protein
MHSNTLARECHLLYPHGLGGYLRSTAASSLNSRMCYGPGRGSTADQLSTDSAEVPALYGRGLAPYVTCKVHKSIRLSNSSLFLL